MADGPVQKLDDEVRLGVLAQLPVLLDAGKRLFSTTDKDTQRLELVEHEAYANRMQKNVFDVVR